MEVAVEKKICLGDEESMLLALWCSYSIGGQELVSLPNILHVPLNDSS